jgi:hypothetical protein
MFGMFTVQGVPALLPHSCIYPIPTERGYFLRMKYGEGFAERDVIVTPGDKPFNRAINEGYTKYEAESVNRSQMDITRKASDVPTWEKKHLCLGICSTNIGTLVPSLY